MKKYKNKKATCRSLISKGTCWQANSESCLCRIFIDPVRNKSAAFFFRPWRLQQSFGHYTFGQTHLTRYMMIKSAVMITWIPVYNPCGESDQFIVHLNVAKNGWAKRSFASKYHLFVFLTRSFASRFVLRFAQPFKTTVNCAKKLFFTNIWNRLIFGFFFDSELK